MAGTCGYGEGLSGSINAGNFFTSLLVSLSRRTLLHGVSKYCYCFINVPLVLFQCKLPSPENSYNR